MLDGETIGSANNGEVDSFKAYKCVGAVTTLKLQ